jgi:predicted  nucleic acid-binding Zn-ribbon protein
MTGQNMVPAKAVAEDRRLEQSASRASESLAKHRWHWTLDETNPERVSLRAYGRAVGRNDRTIRKYAIGYREWIAYDGVRNLSEVMERANLTAEKEEIVEAVAEANEISFQRARQEYAPDVSRVRDAVEQAVERKPDMTADDKADYVKRTAQTIARSKAADAKRTKERAAQRSVMFMRIDAKLAHARGDLRDVLEFGRDLGLGDDEIEDVKEALAKIKSFADLIDMALTGSMDVDWDAELAKIGGDS